MSLEHKTPKIENENLETLHKSVEGTKQNNNDALSMQKKAEERRDICEDVDSKVRITPSAMRYIQKNVSGMSEDKIVSKLSAVLKDCGVEKIENIKFVLDSKSTLKHLDLPFFREPNKKINGSYDKKHVNLNAEYAIRLLTDDREYNYKGMVKQTIGHERGHQDKKMLLSQAPMDAKFINYMNEVYADFYGAREAFGGSAIYASEVMEQRHAYKKSIEGKDEPDDIHPSWTQRANFVTQGYEGQKGKLTGNFDGTLIKEIAAITGCTNDDLIARVTNYFNPIELDHSEKQDLEKIENEDPEARQADAEKQGENELVDNAEANNAIKADKDID